VKIKKILVAVDFSKLSYAALDYAIDLARELGARLTAERRSQRSRSSTST
jgi:nucleotide-binding universal stress UspA family protein